MVLGAGSIGNAGGLRLGHFAAMRWADPDQADVSDDGAGGEPAGPGAVAGGVCGRGRARQGRRGCVGDVAARGRARVGSRAGGQGHVPAGAVTQREVQGARRGTRDRGRQGPADRLVPDGHPGWHSCAVRGGDCRVGAGAAAAPGGRGRRREGEEAESADVRVRVRPQDPRCSDRVRRWSDHVWGLRNRLRARPSRPVRGRRRDGRGGGGVSPDQARSPAVDAVAGARVSRLLDHHAGGLPARRGRDQVQPRDGPSRAGGVGWSLSLDPPRKSE